MQTETDLEIIRLEAALAEALARKSAEQPDTAEQELATALHESMCTWNHTDGCSWLYETSPSFPTPTWESYAHKQYLIKARRAMQANGGSADGIVAIFKAVNSRVNIDANE